MENLGGWVENLAYVAVLGSIEEGSGGGCVTTWQKWLVGWRIFVWMENLVWVEGLVVGGGCGCGCAFHHRRSLRLRLRFAC